MEYTESQCKSNIQKSVSTETPFQANETTNVQSMVSRNYGQGRQRSSQPGYQISQHPRCCLPTSNPVKNALVGMKF